MLPDLFLGTLAIVWGLAMSQSAETGLATLVGLVAAALGLLLIVGSVVERRTRRR